MNLTNNSDEYDYDNSSSLSNCTKNENNFDIFIQALLLTIPCGLSFLCLISIMVYTLVKPLIKNKWIIFYTQNIQFAVS